jgi:NAD(P)-dependent dehydrogenase (short-subunit alcohol dehydrogenase family)
MADTVEEALGPVDIVCNNAGVAIYGPMTSMSLADWHFVMDVNFWGVVHGVRTFAPRLLERGNGYVLNTASMAGLVGMTGLGVYNASKFAVVGLSESLAREVAPHGVGVTVLCPMMVETPINVNSMRAWARATGRPDPEIPEPTADAELPRDPSPGLRGGFVDVATVVERTIAAMRAGDLYVLTHADQRELLARRAARLDAAAP